MYRHKPSPEENPALTIIKVSGINEDCVRQTVARIEKCGLDIRGKPFWKFDEMTGVHRVFIHVSNPKTMAAVVSGCATIPEMWEEEKRQS